MTWLGYEQKYLQNLNDATVHDDELGQGIPIGDRPHRKVPVTSGKTTVIFDRHAYFLSEIIRDCQCVVGCMAWLTNEQVLLALRGRVVQIIVQKEDWLRPDAGDWSKARLRELYAGLTGPDDKYVFGHGYNYCGDPEYEAIRCAGIINQGPTKVRPRMHHKFLVFCDIENRVDGPHDVEHTVYVPKGVWTGSFNATYNGTLSLENCVVIEDEVIAQTYMDEWGSILGFSEPLDWNAQWIASPMRIGS